MNNRDGNFDKAKRALGGQSASVVVKDPTQRKKYFYETALLHCTSLAALTPRQHAFLRRGEDMKCAQMAQMAQEDQEDQEDQEKKEDLSTRVFRCATMNVVKGEHPRICQIVVESHTCAPYFQLALCKHKSLLGALKNHTVSARQYKWLCTIQATLKPSAAIYTNICAFRPRIRALGSGMLSKMLLKFVCNCTIMNCIMDRIIRKKYKQTPEYIKKNAQDLCVQGKYGAAISSLTRAIQMKDPDARAIKSLMMIMYDQADPDGTTSPFDLLHGGIQRDNQACAGALALCRALSLRCTQDARICYNLYSAGSRDPYVLMTCCLVAGHYEQNIIESKWFLLQIKRLNFYLADRVKIILAAFHLETARTKKDNSKDITKAEMYINNAAMDGNHYAKYLVSVIDFQNTSSWPNIQYIFRNVISTIFYPSISVDETWWIDL